MQAAAILSIVSMAWLWPSESQINCKTGSLVQLDAETVLAAWYGGTEKHIPKENDSAETALWISRLNKGTWSKPECIFQEKGYHVWNPVLVKTASKLYVFFRKFQAEVAEPQKQRVNRSFTYCVMESDNKGISWSAPKQLTDGITGPIKSGPHVLEDGSWIIPSAKKDSCFIERTSDCAKTVTTLGPVTRPNGSQMLSEPTLVQKNDGTFTLFFRNRQTSPQDRYIMTATFDPKTQKISHATPTTLPNPDSGIDCYRLHDGRWLLACNSSFTKRSTLAVYISSDEGLTWKEALKVEEGDDEYSQPALLQAEDGNVHLLYAVWEAKSGKKNIKHVAFAVQSRD